MRRKAFWPLLAAAVALFFLAGWGGQAHREDSPKSGRVLWEYKTVRGSRALRDDQLNELGALGWELVMFDDGERGNGSYEGVYYFKRAR